MADEGDMVDMRDDTTQALEMKVPVAADEGVSIRIGSTEPMTDLTDTGSNSARDLNCRVELADCRVEGKATTRPLEGGGTEVRTTLVHPGQNDRCMLVQRFKPGVDSISWEIGITGDGEPWSVPIHASVRYPAKTDTLFWTAWDAPPDGDLLKPAPLSAGRCYTYGAPRYTMERPGMPWWNCGQRPNGEHYIALPLVTLIEPGQAGFSLVASPEPMQFDMEMAVGSDGSLRYSWYRHRIAKNAPFHLALNLVSHEPGWRGGLRWMTRRYPQFFDPPNPAADMMAGCGNYAMQRRDLDLPELRRMGFSINWCASFDFPYMGMFLPPLSREEIWQSFNHQPTSIAGMQDYAKWMRDKGFHLLNYFNVTEFGTKVRFPPPTRTPSPKETAPDWKDANEFLFNRLGSAIVHVPEELNLAPTIEWPGGGWDKTRTGGLFYTWEEGVVTDCGEPVYRDFLLEQARRHLDGIPSSSGIAIDRMDWLRVYNLDSDDGVSWFDGAPARSLIWSWRTLMERLGPLMHDGGKVIFVSPLDKRLDLMQHVDGIFDECPGMNGDALLGVRKPVLIFNGELDEKIADSFLQNCLHLGVYPMCPLPGNDHGLGWGTPEQRRPHLDYGLLLAEMRSKKWVLEPDCIETATPGVRANLFEVPGGYVIPVTCGGQSESSIVRVRNVPGLDKARCTALQPGVETALATVSSFRDGVLEIKVPLTRGCAVVRMDTK